MQGYDLITLDLAPMLCTGSAYACDHFVLASCYECARQTLQEWMGVFVDANVTFERKHANTAAVDRCRQAALGGGMSVRTIYSLWRLCLQALGTDYRPLPAGFWMNHRRYACDVLRLSVSAAIGRALTSVLAAITLRG